MAIVRKRSKSDSLDEMQQSIKEFAKLLQIEGEEDASTTLLAIVSQLNGSTVESETFQKAMEDLKECFDGEHELGSYTMRKAKDGEWTNADSLFLVSTKLRAIMRRFGS